MNVRRGAHSAISSCASTGRSPAFKVPNVAEDAPYSHDFYEGAKGVQLAELGLESWAEQRWLDVPALPRVGTLQPV